MTNLPEDVLSKIFVWLKAKQVVQMRCLSRSWNSLLSESFFIKSHLDRSVNNNDGILLVGSHIYSTHSRHMTAHSSRSPHFELTNSFKLPVNPQSKNSRGSLIGSVNGLICFKYRDAINAIYIWNPSLSAVLCLPPYSVISDFDHHIRVNFFQFGFDPKTHDFKVVNLIQLYNKAGLVKLQAESYSMKKGSWELISQQIPSHIKWIHDKAQVCVGGHDGHLHWLASKLEYLETILAFDLGAETFREILLPDSVRDVKAISNHLGVLMRKLCVMSKFPCGKFEVWVMDESWVKHHVIPPFSANIHPYGFTLHNEFLFRVYPHGLALYDPVATTTKLFKLQGECRWVCKIVEFVDSLVWVTPAK